MTRLLERSQFAQSTLASTLAACAGLLGIASLIRFSLGLPVIFILQVLAVFGLVATLLVVYLPRAPTTARFGPANRVTLIRATLVTLLIGFIGTGYPMTMAAWTIVGFATLVLLLDGVDGWLARRTGTVSAFGARFDMETDALLIAVLAVLVYQADKAGPWVLGSGALRYAFVGAGLALPWLRADLPYSRRRQAVCVGQTLILILCLVPWIQAAWSHMLAALGLLLLTASFTVDTLWLARRAE